MVLQESFERQGIWLFRYRGVIPVFILLIGAALYKFYYVLFCLLIGLAFTAYTVVLQ